MPSDPIWGYADDEAENQSLTSSRSKEGAAPGTMHTAEQPRSSSKPPVGLIERKAGERNAQTLAAVRSRVRLGASESPVSSGSPSRSLVLWMQSSDSGGLTDVRLLCSSAA